MNNYCIAVILKLDPSGRFNSLLSKNTEHRLSPKHTTILNTGVCLVWFLLDNFFPLAVNVQRCVVLYGRDRCQTHRLRIISASRHDVILRMNALIRQLSASWHSHFILPIFNPNLYVRLVKRPNFRNYSRSELKNYFCVR